MSHTTAINPAHAEIRAFSEKMALMGWRVHQVTISSPSSHTIGDMEPGGTVMTPTGPVVLRGPVTLTPSDNP